MTITCFIRYQIDPFQRDEFKKVCREHGAASFPAAGDSLWVIFCLTKGRTTSRGD